MLRSKPSNSGFKAFKIVEPVEPRVEKSNAETNLAVLGDHALKKVSTTSTKLDPLPNVGWERAA